MVYTGPVVALPANSENPGSARVRGEYFPYGKASDRRDERNRYRYIGVERDQLTGLALAGPRVLDLATGRFLQADPVLRESESPFSQSNSSPVLFSDPSGYSPGLVFRAPQSDTRPKTLEDSSEMARSLIVGNQAVSSRSKTDALSGVKVHGLKDNPEARVEFLLERSSAAAEAAVAQMTTEEKKAFYGSLAGSSSGPVPSDEYLVEAMSLKKQAKYLSELQTDTAFTIDELDEIVVASGKFRSPEVLVHEYIHVLAADGFRAAAPKGLTEGATQYITELVVDGVVFFDETGKAEVPDRAYGVETQKVAGLIESGAFSESQLLDAVLVGDEEAIAVVVEAWNNSSGKQQSPDATVPK